MSIDGKMQTFNSIKEKEEVKDLILKETRQNDEQDEIRDQS
jgi:hypothetical protein